MNQKPSFFRAVALAVMATSVLALPLSAVTAAIVFSVAGTLAVLVADYGRKIEPIRVEAPVVAFGSPSEPAREQRQAA